MQGSTRRLPVDAEIFAGANATNANEIGPRPQDLFGSFTWKLDNFNDISKRELRSEVFDVGTTKWYLLVYPQGCDVSNHLSLFLCVADYDKRLPGWSHFAQFTIAVINKDPKKSKYSDTLHRFCKKEHDWGWKKFMELGKVMDGFLVAGTLVIKAQVQVIPDKPTKPFRCLDPHYRRELVRVYLSNVEGVCQQFCDDKRARLLWARDTTDRFSRFWASLRPDQQYRLLTERDDVVLKGVVKQFFNEKEVTSTLVMDALYSGCKQVEQSSRAFLAGQCRDSCGPVALIKATSHLVLLRGDVRSLAKVLAQDPIPASRDMDKLPGDGLALRSCLEESSEAQRASILRDERRLAELGRCTLEVFVIHLFGTRLEVAFREVEALRRQDLLIAEEQQLVALQDLRRREQAEKERGRKAKRKARPGLALRNAPMYGMYQYIDTNEKAKSRKLVDQAHRAEEEGGPAPEAVGRRAAHDPQDLTPGPPVPGVPTPSSPSSLAASPSPSSALASHDRASMHSLSPASRASEGQAAEEADAAVEGSGWCQVELVHGRRASRNLQGRPQAHGPPAGQPASAAATHPPTTAPGGSHPVDPSTGKARSAAVGVTPPLPASSPQQQVGHASGGPQLTALAAAARGLAPGSSSSSSQPGPGRPAGSSSSALSASSIWASPAAASMAAVATATCSSTAPCRPAQSGQCTAACPSLPGPLPPTSHEAAPDPAAPHGPGAGKAARAPKQPTTSTATTCHAVAHSCHNHPTPPPPTPHTGPTASSPAAPDPAPQRRPWAIQLLPKCSAAPPPPPPLHSTPPKHPDPGRGASPATAAAAAAGRAGTAAPAALPLSKGHHPLAPPQTGNLTPAPAPPHMSYASSLVAGKGWHASGGSSCGARDSGSAADSSSSCPNSTGNSQQATQATTPACPDSNASPASPPRSPPLPHSPMQHPPPPPTPPATSILPPSALHNELTGSSGQGGAPHPPPPAHPPSLLPAQPPLPAPPGPRCGTDLWPQLEAEQTADCCRAVGPGPAPSSAPPLPVPSGLPRLGSFSGLGRAGSGCSLGCLGLPLVMCSSSPVTSVFAPLPAPLHPLGLHQGGLTRQASREVGALLPAASGSGSGESGTTGALMQAAAEEQQGQQGQLLSRLGPEGGWGSRGAAGVGQQHQGYTLLPPAAAAAASSTQEGNTGWQEPPPALQPPSLGLSATGSAAHPAAGRPSHSSDSVGFEPGISTCSAGASGKAVDVGPPPSYRNAAVGKLKTSPALATDPAATGTTASGKARARGGAPGKAKAGAAQPPKPGAQAVLCGVKASEVVEPSVLATLGSCTPAPSTLLASAPPALSLGSRPLNHNAPDFNITRLNSGHQATSHSRNNSNSNNPTHAASAATRVGCAPTTVAAAVGWPSTHQARAPGCGPGPGSGPGLSSTESSAGDGESVSGTGWASVADAPSSSGRTQPASSSMDSHASSGGLDCLGVASGCEPDPGPCGLQGVGVTPTSHNPLRFGAGPACFHAHLLQHSFPLLADSPGLDDFAHMRLIDDLLTE
ncbi:hypothetical protein QJQ45_018317 [Haematococcus lacustris]|nr:hypothetical protein QJQ45_018317 [Haematococcus lacustris]